MKKKPLLLRPHHLEGEGLVEESWVTSVTAYPSSDLLASGMAISLWYQMHLINNDMDLVSWDVPSKHSKQLETRNSII